MKIQFFFFIAAFFLAGKILAQSNTFPANGPVGIGTTAPTYRLDIVAPQVSGSETVLRMRASDAPNDYLSFQNATNGNNAFIPAIRGVYATDNLPSIMLIGEIIPSNDNSAWPILVFDSRSTNSAVINRNLFSWRNYGNELMVMNPSGNLGIGTITPTQKLEVNGNIKTKEVNVTAAGWPDYVFAPEYPLISLDSLSDFIHTNKHLPDVPSEKTVLENGVNVGEMNAILLKKIEELTLYMLKQDEEMKSLKASNYEIREELKSLLSKINTNQ